MHVLVRVIKSFTYFATHYYNRTIVTEDFPFVCEAMSRVSCCRFWGGKKNCVIFVIFTTHCFLFLVDSYLFCN